MIEQARNKRRTIMVEIEGKQVPLIEYCQANGLDHRIIRQRIARGTPLAEALSPEIIRPKVYRGEQQANSKLTDVKVAEIRKRLRQGESQCGLAKEYGVTQTCIFHISTGRSWRHVA